MLRSAFPKRWHVGFGCLAIAAVIFHSVYSIKTTISIWHDNEHPYLARIFTVTDPIYQSAASNSRTVFIEFQGFAPADAELARTYFIRAAYELTPDRVLVADPASAIFGSEELLADNFHPDDAWLDSHHVDLVLVIRHVPGEVQIQLKPRAKDSA